MQPARVQVVADPEAGALTEASFAVVMDRPRSDPALDDAAVLDRHAVLVRDDLEVLLPEWPGGRTAHPKAHGLVLVPVGGAGECADAVGAVGLCGDLAVKERIRSRRSVHRRLRRLPPGRAGCRARRARLRPRRPPLPHAAPSAVACEGRCRRKRSRFRCQHCEADAEVSSIQDPVEDILGPSHRPVGIPAAAGLAPGLRP